MTSRPARTLDVVALLVVTLTWATAGASSASPAPGDPSAATPAAVAVTAVTTRTADTAAAIPADFESVMGYRPRVRHGLLVDPDGTCSSPVPLPEGFTPACAEHDLGYDLLRYADLTGDPLAAWARTAVDQRLDHRMRAACADLGPGVGRAVCSAAAHLVTLSVEVNSVRQLRGVPEETLASWAVTALATGAAAMMSLRLVAMRRRRLDPAALAVALAPSVCTSTLAALAFALSLLPSLLPRPALAQAVLSGLLVAVAVGLAQPLGRVERRLLPSSVQPLLRWVGLCAALGLGLAALPVADAWLQEGRRAVGAPPAEGHYWPTVLAGAAALVALLLALGRGARRLLRRLSTPRVLRVLAVCAVLPLVVGAADGGAMLTGLPFPGEDEPTLSLPSRAGAVRVYVGIEEGRTPAERAALAVRRMERRGAFEREAVLVAFPTGTGWVNLRAVNSFERAFGGDLATVAMQGGTAPSWVELLVNRRAQEASAQALFDAVSERLAAMPPGRRPDLHLYGESLGALLGQSVLDDDRGAVPVCSVVWAGVPGGAELGIDGERVLRNPDDPVAFWGVATAVERPEGWPADTPWIPGLSYVTTSLDLVAALGTTPGHGHVYGDEQPWRQSRTCG
jgi:uncharacterized membrane protein